MTLSRPDGGEGVAVSRGFDWWRLLPRYWGQNYPTCREWDAVLNGLLDAFDPAPGMHTANLGGIEVWTQNWPYAYGSQYSPLKSELLPMVRTRKRLRLALQGRNFTAARAAIAKAIGS